MKPIKYRTLDNKHNINIESIFIFYVCIYRNIQKNDNVWNDDKIQRNHNGFLIRPKEYNRMYKPL